MRFVGPADLGRQLRCHTLVSGYFVKAKFSRGALLREDRGCRGGAGDRRAGCIAGFLVCRVSVLRISTTGISPRSTAPESSFVIRRVGGDGGRLGGGEPVKGNDGGKHPSGNQPAAFKLPWRSASEAIWYWD